MDKNYQKIEFQVGCDIQDVVNRLLKYKDSGILVYGEFNGTKLYSDTVTLDGAYMEITGKTIDEFNEALEQQRKKYEKEEQEHKNNIPSLSKEWMKKGREILSADEWELWDKIVPIRLNDIYQGMELGASLDIIKILNNGGSLDEAKDAIESQGHSGMSFGLVCSMVREFCDRGQEFVGYVK
jgi:hypothetical protein